MGHLPDNDQGHSERAQVSVILPGMSPYLPFPDLLPPLSTDLCLYGAIWRLYFLITMLPTPKACDASLGCWRCGVKAPNWGGHFCPLSQNSEGTGRGWKERPQVDS